MFHEEFYPTPIELIKKMLKPYKAKERVHTSYFHSDQGYDVDYYKIQGSVLDPSAGKGDILNFIDSVKRHNMTDFYAIELNPELKIILQENYSVIGSDFLNYEPDLAFDYIFMNPPFSNGDEHLLKAIEISENTEIVCILNAETIRNPHTKRRKLLLEYIEKYNGTIEFVKNAFKNAERKTNVEVAIVRLKVVKETNKFSFDFSDYEPENIKLDETFLNNEIARKDTIGNMMQRFEKAKESYVELMKAQDKFTHYSSYIWEGTDKAFDDVTTSKGSKQHRYNYFSQKMKSIMWRKIISQLDLKKHMTSKIISNFDTFVNQQSKMAFTRENVQEFFQFIMMNKNQILEQAIVDVFDKFTEYHKENRMIVEGWKTNSSWKVNQKVILPSGVDLTWPKPCDQKSYGTNFKLNWRDSSYFNDIDKVLCYISGKTLSAIATIEDSLKIQFNRIGKIYPGDSFDNTCESEFFKMKFWKKGTLHLVFKDKWLWTEFNMRACADKNWLPPTERKEWENSKSNPQKTQSNILIEEFSQTLF